MKVVGLCCLRSFRCLYFGLHQSSWERWMELLQLWWGAVWVGVQGWLNLGINILWMVPCEDTWIFERTSCQDRWIFDISPSFLSIFPMFSLVFPCFGCRWLHKALALSDSKAQTDEPVEVGSFSHYLLRSLHIQTRWLALGFLNHQQWHGTTPKIGVVWGRCFSFSFGMFRFQPLAFRGVTIWKIY